MSIQGLERELSYAKIRTQRIAEKNGKRKQSTGDSLLKIALFTVLGSNFIASLPKDFIKLFGYFNGIPTMVILLIDISSVVWVCFAMDLESAREPNPFGMRESRSYTYSLQNSASCNG